MGETLQNPRAVAQAFEAHRKGGAPLGKAEKEAFAAFMRDTVKAVLGTAQADVPRPLSAWNPTQRAVLEEIAKTPAKSMLNRDDLSDLLVRVGAVRYDGNDDDRLLARYAGLREPSVLETEVGDKPLWLVLRLYLMGKAKEAEWRKATDALTSEERIDLVRRATDDAYHLTRRWPLPGGADTEVEDTEALHRSLLLALEPMSKDELRKVLDTELDHEMPSDNVILLVAFAYVSKGGKFDEAPRELLGPSLEIPTSVPVGRRLLEKLPKDQALALVQRIELTPYNLAGWPYLDVLSPAERASAIGGALKGFTQACTPEVAAEVKRLVETLDAKGRAALSSIASSKGPNAKLVASALETAG